MLNSLLSESSTIIPIRIINSCNFSRVTFYKLVEILHLAEICNCVREREGRNGGAALPKRGEAAKNGGSPGTEAEDSARS